MVYELIACGLFEKELIAWETHAKTVYDICSCCRHLGFTQK